MNQTFNLWSENLRPFERAVQEKRYNLNPVMVCGSNVDNMIQEQLVSTHVIYHIVHEADVSTRTSDDILRSGIWPRDWDPREMLGDVNERAYSKVIL